MAKLGEYGDRLKDMSAQEVFDVVCDHLLTQNERSEIDDGNGTTCLYNGDGMCCAAAPFIKKYDPTMENANWESVVGQGFADVNHLDLIEALQNVHDRSDVNEWYDGLNKLAKIHNLKFNPPDCAILKGSV